MAAGCHKGCTVVETWGPLHLWEPHNDGLGKGLGESLGWTWFLGFNSARWPGAQQGRPHSRAATQRRQPHAAWVIGFFGVSRAGSDRAFVCHGPPPALPPERARHRMHAELSMLWRPQTRGLAAICRGSMSGHCRSLVCWYILQYMLCLNTTGSHGNASKRRDNLGYMLF